MFLVEGSQQLRIERAAIAEHRKKDASEFVSGSGDGCRGTEFGTTVLDGAPAISPFPFSPTY
jgi:hypothetical protein